MGHHSGQGGAGGDKRDVSGEAAREDGVGERGPAKGQSESRHATLLSFVCELLRALPEKAGA